MWTRLVKVMVAVCLTSHAAYADGTSADTVVAAVDTANDADIGRPYTASFLPVSGKESKSVFPGSKALRKNVVNEWRSDFSEINTLEALQANAGAWGLGSVSVSTAGTKRYLVFRVRSVEYEKEIDDSTEMRTIDTTGKAAYYLSKVYYGRMYEIVLSGTTDVLDARVESEILLSAAKLGIEGIKKTFKVNVTQKAKGLKPNGASMFALDVNEIKLAYQNSDMGSAVPILVEYRRIPSASVEAQTSIDWTPTHTAAPRDQLKIRRFRVAGNNANWSAAGLELREHDVLIGSAEGNVNYSNWNPAVDADAKGDGGLQIQVGMKELPAGKVWATTGIAGTVQLKVRDGDYGDNKGGYNVTLLVITESMLLNSECQKAIADGTFTNCR